MTDQKKPAPLLRDLFAAFDSGWSHAYKPDGIPSPDCRYCHAAKGAYALGFAAGLSTYRGDVRNVGRDSYSVALGAAVDMPLNAAAYILTDGGDAMKRGGPGDGLNEKTLPMLGDRVAQVMRAFSETSHCSPYSIREGGARWLKSYGIEATF